MNTNSTDYSINVKFMDSMIKYKFFWMKLLFFYISSSILVVCKKSHSSYGLAVNGMAVQCIHDLNNLNSHSQRLVLDTFAQLIYRDMMDTLILVTV